MAYVDVDKFLKTMIEKFKCVPLVGVSKYIQGEECFEGEHLDVLIKETPTADVVEVVRCKDCQHLEIDKGLREGRMCLMRGGAGWCHDNDFCSYGEKVTK